MVALPTPFHDDAVDLTAFRRFAEHLVAGGVDGLVVCGTTGETPTLDADERAALIRTAVDVAAGRIPVVAGAGTNATHTTLREMARAEDLGADGLLVVTPYYNRPCQDGLRRHFAAVAEAARAPVVLYNVPKRTGVDLLPATAARIAREHERVVAIKEAHAAEGRWREHAELGALDVLCGEDSELIASRRAGAVGWVGVLPNLAPAECVELFRTAAPEPEGSPAALAAAEARLAPLFRALATAGNPAAVKAGLAEQGWMRGELRSPLVEPSEELRRAIATELQDFTPAPFGLTPRQSLKPTC